MKKHLILLLATFATMLFLAGICQAEPKPYHKYIFKCKTISYKCTPGDSDCVKKRDEKHEEFYKECQDLGEILKWEENMHAGRLHITVQIMPKKSYQR